MFSKPVIQAVDEPEGTIYVLLRPGREPLAAHWPQLLEAIEPEAVRVPAQLGNPNLGFG